MQGAFRTCRDIIGTTENNILTTQGPCREHTAHGPTKYLRSKEIQDRPMLDQIDKSRMEGIR
jgi:hypothetical protein